MSTSGRQWQRNDHPCGHVLFVVLQRGQRDLCPLRVGPMHGLAVVAESQLRESLGVARYLSPF